MMKSRRISDLTPEQADRVRELDRARYLRRRERFIAHAKERYSSSKKVRDAHREQAKQWGRKNRHRLRHRRVVRELGITLDQIEKMKADQKGKCKICQETHTDGTRKGTLRLDHNHKTKQIRSMLCFRCNLGLGYFQDDPDRLRAAADYLEHHNKEKS